MAASDPRHTSPGLSNAATEHGVIAVHDQSLAHPDGLEAVEANRSLAAVHGDQPELQTDHLLEQRRGDVQSVAISKRRS